MLHVRELSPLKDISRWSRAAIALMPARARSAVAVRAAAIKVIGPALAAVGMLAASGTAHAQEYPSRPVRIVVPFAPGGGVDALVRAYGLKLSASLGQPVLIDNRPGANGAIAAALVARSPADGYTLLASGSWLQTGSFLSKSLAYNPERDFTPISLLAKTPLQVFVRSEVPAKSMQELITYAKAHPGKLTYGSNGVGHPFHLATEMLKHVTKMDILHIPFKGTAPATQEMLAGRLDLLFYPPGPTLVEMVKSGKARAVASATDERLAYFPEVPTLRELGIGNVETAADISLVGPAGLPRTIVSRIHAELVKASASPELSSVYERQALVKSLSTPEELGLMMQREMRSWEPVIKSLNLQTE